MVKYTLFLKGLIHAPWVTDSVLSELTSSVEDLFRALLQCIFVAGSLKTGFEKDTIITEFDEKSEKFFSHLSYLIGATEIDIFTIISSCENENIESTLQLHYEHVKNFGEKINGQIKKCKESSDRASDFGSLGLLICIFLQLIIKHLKQINETEVILNGLIKDLLIYAKSLRDIQTVESLKTAVTNSLSVVEGINNLITYATSRRTRKNSITDKSNPRERSNTNEDFVVESIQDMIGYINDFATHFSNTIKCIQREIDNGTYTSRATHLQMLAKLCSRMIQEVKKISQIQISIECIGSNGEILSFSELSKNLAQIESSETTRELNLLHLKLLLEAITGKSLNSVLRSTLTESISSSNPDSETAESEGSDISETSSENSLAAPVNSDNLPPIRNSDESFILSPTVGRAHSGSSTPNVEIVFGDSPTGGRLVEKGTLKGFIGYMTSSAIDSQFKFDFFYSYRCFTSSETILQTLIQSFQTGNEMVQLRVVTLTSWWFTHIWDDFINHSSLIKNLETFLTSVVLNLMPGLAQNLLSKIQMLKTNPEVEFYSTGEKIKPILIPYKGTQNTKTETWGILEFHPLELARQMTLTEHTIFKMIKLSEFERLGWTRNEKEDLSPNILKMIARFNQTTSWVTYHILKEKEALLRARYISRFIKLAEILQTKCNNFNGVIEILAALSSTPISRLKQSWNYVSPKRVTLFQKLLSLLEKNYKGLRSAVNEAKQPSIPYLGIYLQDLIFIDEGNQTTTENGFLNFDKFRQISAVFQRIKESQKISYPFEQVAFVQEFISKAPSMTDDDFYELSIQLEPRGAEPVAKPSFIERSYLQMKSSRVDKKKGTLKPVHDSRSTDYQISHNFLTELVESTNINMPEENNCIYGTDDNFFPIVAATPEKILEKITNWEFTYGPLSKGSPSVTEFKQKCDICGDSIIEIAMKCLNCSTFLCTKCDQAHDVSHLLLKLTFEPKMKVPTFAVLGNTDSLNHLVNCDRCNNGIQGKRFKCLNCNYNLCASCEKSAWIFHHRNHAFIQIRKPILGEEVKKIPILPPLQEGDMDNDILEVFLLTYRSFTTSSAIMDYLEKRWEIASLEGKNSKIYDEMVIDVIKNRVFVFLSTWIEKYNEDFLKPELKARVQTFLKQKVQPVPTFEVLALQLLIKLDNIFSEADAIEAIPYSEEKISLITIEPTEFAEQLTIYQYTHISKLKAVDLLTNLDPAYSSRSAPLQVFEQINSVPLWIAREILSESNVESQMQIIINLIDTAFKLSTLQNFFATQSIINAFKISYISKLTIWKLIPSRKIEILEKLCSLFSPDQNYKMYRRRLDEVFGPCIPLLDLCIQDLQQWKNTHDSQFYKDTKLINFERECMLGTFSFVVEKLLKPKYAFKEIQKWQSWIDYSLWNNITESELALIADELNEDTARNEIINELKATEKTRSMGKRSFLHSLKKLPNQEITKTLKRESSEIMSKLSPGHKKREKTPTEDQLGDSPTDKKGTRPASRSLLGKIKRVASSEFLKKGLSERSFANTEEPEKETSKSAESYDELTARIRELELRLQQETEARVEAERKISKIQSST